MQAKVSFTQKVKEELCTIEFSDIALRSLLSAFVKVNCVLSFRDCKKEIILRTENAKIAKMIYKAIGRLYGVPRRFVYAKAMNFKKKLYYNIVVEEAEYVLSDLEVSMIETKIPKNIVSSDEAIATYLCGAFLSSGSCNSPKKSNYHLEIALNDENYAKWFVRLFNKYNGGEFDAKIIQRRKQFVVYLKKSAQISDFLILIGATNSALEFENVRISRDFSNIGNRLSNLDAANLAKTNKAAKSQIEDIKIIDEIIGIDAIENNKQKELMKLRLEDEDASLQELAYRLSERIDSTVSRSNINHLFRAIHVKANQYRDIYLKNHGRKE